MKNFVRKNVDNFFKIEVVIRKSGTRDNVNVDIMIQKYYDIVTKYCVQQDRDKVILNFNPDDYIIKEKKLVSMVNDFGTSLYYAIAFYTTSDKVRVYNDITGQSIRPFKFNIRGGKYFKYIAKRIRLIGYEIVGAGTFEMAYSVDHKREHPICIYDKKEM